MPCPPSWEEQMVMKGDAAARILQTEYPLLKQRYAELNEILNYFNVTVPASLIFKEEIPIMPALGEGWPTQEEGDAMAKFSDEVIALFSNLERTICEISTILVLALDKSDKASDSVFGEKIQKQIELHKIHREEDRQETLRNLRNYIRSIDNNILNNKNISVLELNKKESFQKQIEILEAKTIEELIRDRSLTNIKYG